ncbi:anthranilate synthase component I [Salisediminibacterium halotolerans]|uniref:Anthranilate synthase component 1 n=1 Tax=Salisediminibacterium halotolerans TaxID=517425 RepID=A0A1H9P3Z2_9BACI|nr:anthranilate synthase component I [Salisediminibacterium haloalkalitolerans]SER42313.1 anthranilate synthase component 1 [Salisediminibacterium haloalkalitolerans]
MFNMTIEAFRKEAEKYQKVPVSASVIADTKTPIQLFYMFDDDASFILESKDPASPWSNYSFIGLSPGYAITDHHGRFQFKDRAGNVLTDDETFEKAWKSALNYLSVSPNGPDIPFPGGAVGYVSFEGYHYEEPATRVESGEEHDVAMIFCETILAYHHSKEELTVIHWQDTSQQSAEKAYAQSTAKVEEVIKTIQSEQARPPSLVPVASPEQNTLFDGVRSNFTKTAFMEAVEKVKTYIAQGDVFQTVLSQRFELPVQSDGLTLYRVLRKVNPSPYLYYIRFHDQEVIGSSPERLIKVDADRSLEVHPIAGTRKRGRTDEEDQMLAKELLADEKERAEHLMLVDLARNDVGRVSEYGSVNVSSFMKISYFSYVMHIISKVTGKLSEDKHPFEALFAAHPAGTVSGAPKVRAVEIIQELEKTRRGVYSGAIAYCGFNDAVDSCIAIRTIILKNKTAYIQAGAGVVQDSDPESEWLETRNKASALIYAIKTAEESFSEEVLKR